MTSPLLVLHCNEDGILMPIAIQLFCNRPKNGRKEQNYYIPEKAKLQKIKIPVFTPKDDPNEWLLAKMFVNNASSHVSILVALF